MSFKEMLRLSSAKITVSVGRLLSRGKRTFSQFSAVQLTSFEFNSDDMTQRFVKELDGNTEPSVCHPCWLFLDKKVFPSTHKHNDLSLRVLPLSKVVELYSELN